MLQGQLGLCLVGSSAPVEEKRKSRIRHASQTYSRRYKSSSRDGSRAVTVRQAPSLSERKQRLTGELLYKRSMNHCDNPRLEIRPPLLQKVDPKECLPVSIVSLIEGEELKRKQQHHHRLQQADECKEIDEYRNDLEPLPAQFSGYIERKVRSVPRAESLSDMLRKMPSPSTDAWDERRNMLEGVQNSTSENIYFSRSDHVKREDIKCNVCDERGPGGNSISSEKVEFEIQNKVGESVEGETAPVSEKYFLIKVSPGMHSFDRKNNDDDDDDDDDVDDDDEDDTDDTDEGLEKIVNKKMKTKKLKKKKMKRNSRKKKRKKKKKKKKTISEKKMKKPRTISVEQAFSNHNVVRNRSHMGLVEKLRAKTSGGNLNEGSTTTLQPSTIALSPFENDNNETSVKVARAVKKAKRNESPRKLSSEYSVAKDVQQSQWPHTGYGFPGTSLNIVRGNGVTASSSKISEAVSRRISVRTIYNNRYRSESPSCSSDDPDTIRRAAEARQAAKMRVLQAKREVELRAEQMSSANYTKKRRFDHVDLEEQRLKAEERLRQREAKQAALAAEVERQEGVRRYSPEELEAMRKEAQKRLKLHNAKKQEELKRKAELAEEQRLYASKERMKRREKKAQRRAEVYALNKIMEIWNEKQFKKFKAAKENPVIERMHHRSNGKCIIDINE